MIVVTFIRHSMRPQEKTLKHILQYISLYG